MRLRFARCEQDYVHVMIRCIKTITAHGRQRTEKVSSTSTARSAPAHPRHKVGRQLLASRLLWVLEIVGSVCLLRSMRNWVVTPRSYFWPAAKVYILARNAGRAACAPSCKWSTLPIHTTETLGRGSSS